MSTVPMSNHLKEVQAEVRGLLKEQGMRATAQRIAVLVILHKQKVPMTHEEVMGLLAAGLYDKASVWRVLSDLAGVGILRRMDLGDRVWRYELVDACRTVTDGHPHFLCEACKEVTCLPSLEVRAKDGVLPSTLLDAEFHIRISGTCGKCIAK
jgi:Fur family ferric uptake transcriptional regulator